jgi:hypothetical protein
MHVADQIVPSSAALAGAAADLIAPSSLSDQSDPGDPRDPSDWAVQSRRVMTRDLLVRAAYAPHGEARALEFRALHLNLPVVAEVAGRLGLIGPRLLAAEQDAMDALLEAVRSFDPYGEVEFSDHAAAYVERRLLPTDAS